MSNFKCLKNNDWVNMDKVSILRIVGGDNGWCVIADYIEDVPSEFSQLFLDKEDAKFHLYYMLDLEYVS